jgi:hypothetical protein
MATVVPRALPLSHQNTIARTGGKPNQVPRMPTYSSVGRGDSYEAGEELANYDNTQDETAGANGKGEGSFEKDSRPETVLSMLQHGVALDGPSSISSSALPDASKRGEAVAMKLESNSSSFESNFSSSSALNTSSSASSSQQGQQRFLTGASGHLQGQSWLSSPSVYSPALRSLPENILSARRMGGLPSFTEGDDTAVMEDAANRPIGSSVTSQSAYAFSAYANWIIPGKLLIGRYPGIDPTQCLTLGCAEAKLRELIGRGGVCTWVSMQRETPPQASAIHGRRHQYHRRHSIRLGDEGSSDGGDEQVVAVTGADSGNDEDFLEAAKDEQLLTWEPEPDPSSPFHEGGRAVYRRVAANRTTVEDASIGPSAAPGEGLQVPTLSLKEAENVVEAGHEENRRYFSAYSPTVLRIAHEKRGIRQYRQGRDGTSGEGNTRRRRQRFLHIPLTDLTAPPNIHDLEDMVATVLRAIDFSDSSDGVPGGAVYLHCWGGKGRSGTVAAAVLSFLYPEASESEILDRLTEAFLTRGADGKTPETAEQLAVLSQFIAKVHRERGATQDVSDLETPALPYEAAAKKLVEGATEAEVGKAEQP